MKASFAIVLALAAATGCVSAPEEVNGTRAPRPSEAPTSATTPSPVARPSLEPQPLELGFEGLGSLRLGESPESSDLVKWDADYCAFPDSPVDQAETGRWIAVGNFTVDAPEPFAASVSAGAVDAIELRNDSLATDRGIRRGSSLGELERLYPELSLYETGRLSTVHHATQGGATMVFEVANANSYWTSEEVDTVVLILVAMEELGQQIGSRAASDYVVGGCL